MAWYFAGTVTVANGQKTVNGAGTDFVSNVLAGQGFVGPDNRTYEIEQVVSATQILLRRPYLGGSAGGQGYDILPTQSLMKDLADRAAELIGSFAAVRDGVGQGIFPVGTAELPALRFIGDQSTGLYRSLDGQVSIASKGNRRFTLGGDFVDLPGIIYTGLGVSTGGAAVEIGQHRTGDGPAYVDFHSRAGSDYEARLVRSSGINGALQLRQTGTANLEIIAEGSSAITLWTNNTPQWALAQDRHFSPITDNVSDLARSDARLRNIYVASGAISTSDARAKLWREGLTDQELVAARRIVAEIGAYQWNDAVAEKGAESARVHYGVRAQQVARILMEEGVEEQQVIDFDPGLFIGEAARPSFRSAFLCFDTWNDRFETKIDRTTSTILGPNGAPIVTETPRVEQVQWAGNRFGLRVDQLTLFITAAVAADLEIAAAERANLSLNLIALENRLAALEASA